MNTTITTRVEKRTPLHFLVDGLQVWVTYLDAKDSGPYGVRFMWMEGPHESTPQKHITEDGGYSYMKYDSSLMPDGTMNMGMTEPETDPEKLRRLQRIWVEYQKQLGQQVFSV